MTFDEESSTTEIHILLSGLGFGESPRWHEDRLWFANWGRQEIVAVDLSGNSEVMARVPTTIPFCIDWLPDGRLLVVSGREGQLLCREPDGSMVIFADLTALSSHPWNDIVVDGRGYTYVNNTGFDFPGAAFAPGTVAVISPDGTPRQVAGGLAFPNGMAVTPDNASLIVAESYGEQLTAFDIATDGSLTNRRVWARIPGSHPDGICLDAEGAIWYGDVPARRSVRVREGGEVLQIIELERGCFACALGGSDGRTLFMMAAEFTDAAGMAGSAATGQVLTAGALAPHAGWP
jgi:sugar lactone lactonase YvrE